MEKLYEEYKLPEILQSIVKKWKNENREFYLSAHNLFYYKGNKINFLYEAKELFNEEWYVKYGNVSKDKELDHTQIQDIAMFFAKFYRTKKWTLLVDWHCNYECRMCPYHGTGTIDGKTLIDKKIEPVMSKEMAYRVVDKLADYGVDTISLMSKGEIFLYKDWYDVAKYIYQKNIKLWTITNGSLLTEEKCKILKELNFTDIRVSLDALTFETYSKVRSSNKKYFESAMNAPLLLKKYGIKTNVHLVKQKENLHEVNMFLEYWKNTDVDSISIANELIFDDELCINKLCDTSIDKEFIHGLCSAYGKYQIMPNGSVRFCCGTANFDEDIYNHYFPDLYILKNEPKDIVDFMNNHMCNIKSPLVNICKKCALYVDHTLEDFVHDTNWYVKKNSERETWYRKG